MIENTLDNLLTRAARLHHQGLCVVEVNPSTIKKESERMAVKGGETRSELDGKGSSDRDERKEKGINFLSQLGAPQIETLANELRKAFENRHTGDHSAKRVTVATVENCVQECIVEGITYGQKRTSELVKKRVAEFRELRRSDKDAKLHGSINENEATSSIVGNRRELNKLALFFTGLLDQERDGGSFSDVCERRVRESDDFSRDVRDALADTFKMISILSKYKSDNYWKGTMRFLEEQRKAYITRKVDSDPKKANRGGKIGLIPTVEAFRRVEEGVEVQDGDWGVLYYLIRCGDWEAAFDYVQNSKDSFDSHVVEAVKLRLNEAMVRPFGRTKDSLVGYLTAEASRGIHANIYEILVLTALTGVARGNEKYGEVIKTVEDWTWLQLQVDHDLDRIEKEISVENRISWSVFGKGQLLLLTRKCDEAVKAFVHSNSSNVLYLANMHIALALHDSGLVKAKIIKKELTEFARIIFKADPVKAGRYLAMLKEEDERISAFVDLIVGTEGGEKMIVSDEDMQEMYSARDDGGCPLSRLVSENDKQKIIRLAGEHAERKGKKNLASKMYRLIDDYDHVINIHSVELVQCIEGFRDVSAIEAAEELRQEIELNAVQAPRTELRKKMSDIKSMYRFKELETLLLLADAAILLGQGKYSDATEQIERTRILPTTRDDVDAAAENIDRMAGKMPHLEKVIGRVLVMAMEAYCHDSKCRDESKIEAILLCGALRNISPLTSKKLSSLAYKKD